MASQGSAEVLSHVPKHMRLWYALQKNIGDKLCSGTGYSAAGCESNVNQATINLKFGTETETHIKGYVLTDGQKCDQRLAFSFSSGATGLVFANSVFAATL